MGKRGEVIVEVLQGHCDSTIVCFFNYFLYYSGLKFFNFVCDCLVTSVKWNGQCEEIWGNQGIFFLTGLRVRE